MTRPFGRPFKTNQIPYANCNSETTSGPNLIQVVWLCSTQPSSAQLSPVQLSPAQLSSAQLSLAQPSSAQLSLAQPSSARLSPALRSSAQLRSAQLSFRFWPARLLEKFKCESFRVFEGMRRTRSTLNVARFCGNTNTIADNNRHNRSWVASAFKRLLPDRC